MKLELKNVSFGFSPEIKIFNGLSFSLEEKKVYALMGSNGAGKTTLFNIISGFIKPQSGNLFWGKTNITRLEPFKINRLGISRTFQETRTITKHTVKANILLTMPNNPSDNWLKAMLPERFHRSTNTLLGKRADEIIQQFYLGEVQHSGSGTISYGQQKLLSLACCVANSAMLLLLDEPIAGIQPEYRNKVALFIKQLKEQGKSILLIEHNTDFIAEVADEIFFLRDGNITTFNNMEDLRKDKQVMEAYI